MDSARAWRGVADAGLAAALATAAVVELTTAGVEHLGVDAPVVGAVGIAATAAVLSQRRLRPALLPLVFVVWLALGLATAGSVPVLFWGALVPFWVALYSAARHGTGRLPLLTAVAAAVTLTAGGLALPVLHSWEEALFDWGTCSVAFLSGWGLRRAEQRAVSEALRASAAEAEARARTLGAVADERARIARELHDVLGHSVSAMVVQAGAAEQVVDDDPDFVRRALASIRAIGTESLDEVRRAVALLEEPDEHPDLAPQPGLDGLPDLVADAAASGLAVDLDVDADLRGQSPGLELAVYRIVQESLTNVVRHSGATRASVRVRCRDGAVEVLVRDHDRTAPGRRPAPAAAVSTPPGHGLIGMRERAHLYGGSFDAGPEPDGFAVRAVLPTGVPA
jgi:signal transduction histidine kinase